MVSKQWFVKMVPLACPAIEAVRDGRIRFVHVAGTNGKGSATVMLASVLHRAGYRVGASVSPYVLELSLIHI